MDLNLKEQLKYYLKKRDLTAAQLSRKTKIAQSVISGWLSGVSPKRIQQVKLVADVFGISIDELCFGPLENFSEKGNSACMPIVTQEWITGTFEVKIRRVK